MPDFGGRREHPRTSAEVTIDWQVLGTEDVIWSATDDVGSGGLRVKTLSPPEVDTELVLILQDAPGEREADRPLRVKARVAWTRLDDEFCGMGVEFIPSSDQEAAQLQEMLKKLSGKLEEA